MWNKIRKIVYIMIAERVIVNYEPITERCDYFNRFRLWFLIFSMPIVFIWAGFYGIYMSFEYISIFYFSKKTNNELSRYANMHIVHISDINHINKKMVNDFYIYEF